MIDCDHTVVTNGLRQRVINENWRPGCQARIALMYLLGKAKGLGKAAILWRPIAAASKPFVSRHTLRIAAHAFTCFLRTLVDTITASILVVNVSDISTWVQQRSDLGAECTGEADCKDQFNNVEPATTTRELQEASHYSQKMRGTTGQGKRR